MVDETRVPTTDTATYALLDIGQIRPNPHQVRRTIGDVKDLAASIREVGLLQPVEVLRATDDPGGYILKYGHRRLEACRIAGLTQVPAIVRQGDETAGKQIVDLLSENLQRADMTEIEEAEALQALLDLGEDSYRTQAMVAGALGVSKARVRNRIALTRLPSEVKERLQNQQMTLTAAEELLAFADDLDATGRLLEAAGTHNWSYQMEDEKRRRRAAQQRQKLQRELEAAKVTIIDLPPDDYTSKAKPVSWLEAADGSRLAADEHASCPHAAVVIAGGHREPYTIAYCTDPEAAGHVVPSFATGASRDRGGRVVTAAEREHRQREAVRREQEAIARKLRADFLSGLDMKDREKLLQVLRLLVAYHVPRFLARQVPGHAIHGEVTVEDIRDLARTLNVTLPTAPQKSKGTRAQALRDLEAARDSWPQFAEALENATAEQCLHALLSLLRHGLEGELRYSFSDRRREGERYLAALAAWGYQPSDTEMQLREEMQAGGAMAAAQEGEEEAADDDAA